MAPPNTTARKILKPKSIAQRAKDNQPIAAPPTTTSPMAESQRVIDNQPIFAPPAAISPISGPERVNQSTPATVEDETEPEGIELIKLIVPILNKKTRDYIELKGKITITSSAATLADLQSASKMIQFLHVKLTTATIDHISAQAGIFFILSWSSSQFTIHDLMLVSNVLRQVLQLADSNIERIWGHIVNIGVLEEMKCGLKELKQQCLFGFAEHYTELLRVLEENEGEEREEEVELGGAAFVSLFPSRRGMARLFCGEEEE